MSTEANKEVARRFFAALSAMDLDATAALMAPDHIFHFPLAPGPMNRDQHAAAQRTGLAAFSEYVVDPIEQIAEGDRVVTLARMWGTLKQNTMGVENAGRRFEVMLVNIMTIRDGLIVDERDEFDTLAYLAQLGVVERP